MEDKKISLAVKEKSYILSVLQKRREEKIAQTPLLLAEQLVVTGKKKQARKKNGKKKKSAPEKKTNRVTHIVGTSKRKDTFVVLGVKPSLKTPVLQDIKSFAPGK